MSDKQDLKQFDFFTERDKLQSEIKDKLLVFLSKCGNSRLQFEINPRYIQGVGMKKSSLIGLEFRIIIES